MIIGAKILAVLCFICSIYLNITGDFFGGAVFILLGWTLVNAYTAEEIKKEVHEIKNILS